MSNSIVPRKSSAIERELAALSLADLIDSLEHYDFECQGGPISHTVEWRELRLRLGHPSPPIQPAPAKIAAAAYTQLLDLQEEIDRREQGRISLINALSEIAERSTSYENAVRLAREQLQAAGCFRAGAGSATRRYLAGKFGFAS